MKYTILTIKALAKRMGCSYNTARNRTMKVATKNGDRWLLSPGEAKAAASHRVNRKRQAISIKTNAKRIKTLKATLKKRK